MFKVKYAQEIILLDIIIVIHPKFKEHHNNSNNSNKENGIKTKILTAY